jgi:penicillin-binding protein 1C
VWRTLVQRLHEGAPSRAPSVPRGVAVGRVAFDGTREPARAELFIEGTEQALQRASAQLTSARRFGITSPRDGSVFALDPDIPPAAQRITFEGEKGTWLLDGKRVGAGSAMTWAPWPGRHELTLLGPGGQALQTVRFDVRGATSRQRTFSDQSSENQGGVGASTPQ